MFDFGYPHFIVDNSTGRRSYHSNNVHLHYTHTHITIFAHLTLPTVNNIITRLSRPQQYLHLCFRLAFGRLTSPKNEPNPKNVPVNG